MVKENTKAAESSAAKETEDLEKLVELTLPLTGTEQDDYPVPVYVNSKRWLIKRGEQVMVPLYVYNLVQETQKAKMEARKYASKKSLSAADEDFRKRYGLA